MIMDMTTRNKFHSIYSSAEIDAFNMIRHVVLYISLVITLTTTSTLQEHINEHGAPHRDALFLLPKALKQTNEKSDEPHLIRYMSDDLQIQEPNAIYLQCLVPQDLHIKHERSEGSDVYTVTWVRELTAGDSSSIGRVQILSRNGKVSSHRRGKSSFDRTIRNRVRSWFSQTTKGDEHVLMIRDTNRSSDEGIYSCQIHLNGNLVETRKSKITFEESDYYDNYRDNYPISNPTLFGHPGRSSQVKQNDSSTNVAQNDPDSNPVTARFVVAKKGMNVILECHDHNVVSTLQQSNSDGEASSDGGGSTKATVKDGKNYVWRKEGDTGKIIGHGKKLKLVKVDRWDNGIYYCSANVHAKGDSALEGTSKQKTAFHLEVAAPRVSSNSPPIKDLGLDDKSLEKLRKTLHRSSTSISSTLHTAKNGVLGKKDALHKNNILYQHAVFGKLGSSITLDCMAEGEPIPNVRWYVDKTIIEEEDNQNSEEQINIMKFPNSNKKMQTNRRKEQDADSINPSPSSFPIFVEETSSADIYSLDNGNRKPTSPQSKKVLIERVVKEEIKSGEDYAITISGYQDGSFQSSLQINNLQNHHFTKYYCEAQNSKGDDGLIIHLLKESQVIKSKSQSSGARNFNRDKLISFIVLQVAMLFTIIVSSN